MKRGDLNVSRPRNSLFSSLQNLLEAMKGSEVEGFLAHVSLSPRLRVHGTRVRKDPLPPFLCLHGWMDGKEWQWRERERPRKRKEGRKEATAAAGCVSAQQLNSVSQVTMLSVGCSPLSPGEAAARFLALVDIVGGEREDGWLARPPSLLPLFDWRETSLLATSSLPCSLAPLSALSPYLEAFGPRRRC